MSIRSADFTVFDPPGSLKRYRVRAFIGIGWLIRFIKDVDGGKLSPLGAGGMGEVYRARDTRLGREWDDFCLVMELIEGETLADRVKAGALPASLISAIM